MATNAWRFIHIPSWGNIHICPVCSATVVDKEVHQKWHASQGAAEPVEAVVTKQGVTREPPMVDLSQYATKADLAETMGQTLDKFTALLADIPEMPKLPELPDFSDFVTRAEFKELEEAVYDAPVEVEPSDTETPTGDKS